MNSRSTRSTTDFTQTAITSLLLPIKNVQQKLTSMENAQQLNTDFVEQQLDSNEHAENSKDPDTHARGHESYDQRTTPNEQQQTLIQLSLKSIQKFNGNGDPQQ